MTFLNPLYLIALAAAAIPIILHLLNLRKTRVIEFSTLAFLKELQRSRIRKLKIKQWLLLALRTLIIVFIVLAFTRPAVRSAFGFLPGTTARTSAVIIIDDSFSMLASDEGGNLFKQAKEKAAAVLEILEAGDEASVVFMSGARGTSHQFTGAVGALRREVSEAEVSFTHNSFADALTAADALFQKSSNFNKELYIISDEQRTHFARPQGRALPKMFDPSVRVFLLPLGDGKTSNTAVSEVIIENSLFEKDKPVDVQSAIFNDGASDLSGALVSVFLDGERVQQKSVDVAAGGRAQVRFTVTPKRSGFIQGFIELEDDDIPEDNRRHFAFFVPENIRILLGPAASRDAEILGIALQPMRQAEGAASFAITAADRNALLSADLDAYDVVALLGAEFSTPAFITRLARFAGNGGGVLLFPDASGNVNTFSNSLLPALSMPAPRGMNGAPGKREAFASFSSVDYDHPLFRSVFASRDEGDKPSVESPRINAHVRLQGSETAAQVITLSGGDAFLLDQRSGAGRVLVLAVPPNLEWSDFPLKGVFVPLLNRAMFYLAKRDENVREALAGTAIEIAVPAASAASKWELVTPRNEKEKLTARQISSGIAFTLDGPRPPGAYALTGDDRTLRMIVINSDPRESMMERISRADRDAFLREAGLQAPENLHRDADVGKAVAQARFGVELWKYMLLMAVLCALAEMLIARDVKRARDGLEPKA